MSKSIALLLNDLAEAVYGYPKQVATLDQDDRLLVEVDNRYVEDLLGTAIEAVHATKPAHIVGDNQLSFNF